MRTRAGSRRPGRPARRTRRERKAGTAAAACAASPDEDHAIVVHVRACGSGDDELAERREETIAVVLGEHLLGLEAHGARARERVGREDGARVVLAAVDAVGVARERPGALLAGERDGEREQELRAAPAASLAANGDRGLAAG